MNLRIRWFRSAKFLASKTVTMKLKLSNGNLHPCKTASSAFGGRPLQAVETTIANAVATARQSN